MKPVPLLPLLLALLLPSLSPAYGQAKDEPSLPDLQDAGALGQDLFAQSGSTGMVLVVVRGGQSFFRGYGETAPGSQALPSQDSVLRLCSLTKIFTTDVLFKLSADRTVHLDDPLQKFVPSRIEVPERVHSITLADLAMHTSGLPRELGPMPKGTPHFTFPDHGTRWEWLPKQKLRSVPGTVSLYSNIGFDLLSDALASATHRQYAALLAERTLNPLHMPNTTYFPTSQQCALLLTGVHDQGPCTSTEETAGSSGLYSNAKDMTNWLKYLLRDKSETLPAQDPGAQDVYMQPSQLLRQVGLDHAGLPTGLGLGWIHIQPKEDPRHIVQKTGGGAGFLTYIAINHERDTAIFLAATDGGVAAHQNLFRAANNLLLTIAGLPPIPEPPARPVRKPKAATPRAKKAAGQGAKKAPAKPVHKPRKRK